MNDTKELMIKVSAKLTKLVSIGWGETFPFWHVCEYPKSGGTWLGRLIADYLRIPLPQHAVFPLGFQCVVHNHWRYHRRLRRCFYLYRDGRDVMVSFYFMRMRGIVDHPHQRYHRKLARDYERLLGRGFDHNDTVRNLPRFIELEMTRPRSARINWPQHVRDWFDPARSHVAYLSYEELLEDAGGTLARCFERLGVESIDLERLRETVDRYSFQRLSGRRPGQEDRSSFLRKGVAGDWVNHFSREAAEIFDHYAGDVLVELGYENSRRWIHERDFTV